MIIGNKITIGKLKPILLLSKVRLIEVKSLIIVNIRLIWRYNLECLGQSSKHIIVSKPLSLNLSAIDIPIKGNVNDNIKT